MFNFFKKKDPIPQTTSKVWMTDNAKWAGLVFEINSLKAKGQKVLLFYYFEATYNAVKAHLERFGLAPVELANSQATNALITVPAMELEHSQSLQNKLSSYMGQGDFALIFAEHYPLFEQEKKVLQLLDTLGEIPEAIAFYFSLEEPLCKVFGSERIIKLMHTMGMKETESIEHRMVTASIKNAQEKLDQKAVGDGKAASQEAWFERFVRN